MWQPSATTLQSAGIKFLQLWDMCGLTVPIFKTDLIYASSHVLISIYFIALFYSSYFLFWEHVWPEPNLRLDDKLWWVLQSGENCTGKGVDLGTYEVDDDDDSLLTASMPFTRKFCNAQSMSSNTVSSSVSSFLIIQSKGRMAWHTQNTWTFIAQAQTTRAIVPNFQGKKENR